ncbi:MAG: PAS domain S-box protein, partial [Bacteroidales bacterium]|nr:PAS domain S-box protein [Bacteroidales bacterium]
SIIISENTEILYFKKSVKQGVNDFIVKPVKKEKLFLAINKLANIIKLEKQVKQQQLTIKNNEQNYRAIYNNLSHSVAILDINTYKIIDANTKTCEEFGYSYNNLLGKKIEELSKGEHPYTEEEAINHIQKCLIKQQHIFEWRAKRKNGSIVWCEISIKKIDINGTERILFIANNIEKRKQEELKSNVNEAKYFNLYDTANDAILLIQNNKFVDCNKKTLELFACSKNDIIGATPFDFSPEKQPNGKSSKTEALKKISNALNKKTQHFEWLHKKLDGTFFHADLSLNKTEINKEVYFQAIVRDITIQKIAEQKLRESKIFLDKISNLSPNGIFVREYKEGKYIFINKTMADMY